MNAVFMISLACCWFVWNIVRNLFDQYFEAKYSIFSQILICHCAVHIFVWRRHMHPFEKSIKWRSLNRSPFERRKRPWQNTDKSENCFVSLVQIIWNFVFEILSEHDSFLDYAIWLNIVFLFWKHYLDLSAGSSYTFVGFHVHDYVRYWLVHVSKF